MEDNIGEKQKIQRIKSIIGKEIEKELVSKQNEVLDISEKIKIVLRNLELLKYVIAVSYFDQNPVLLSKKNQDEDNNEEENPQMQIHPCVKKLLPFRENYNKSFGDALGSHAYETRNKKKTGCGDSTSVEIKKEASCNAAPKSSDGGSGNLKIPQYIPPLPNTDEAVMTVNSARGDESKENFRIVIGNVSKWLPPDTREDSSTYKWMVYIRNKDDGKDITKLLKKIRYFLHESYKPHDIIDVTAPFQLTRRGWGEFPIRAQLHFLHPLNKPVDIIHNLKLDMSCSGVQMLGAETLVEISLHQGVDSGMEAAKKKPESDSIKKEAEEEKVVAAEEKQDVFDGSLLTSISSGLRANPDVKQEPEEVEEEVEEKKFSAVIKQEPEEDGWETKEFFNPKMEEIKSAISNSRKFLLDRRKAMKIIEIEHDYLEAEEKSIGDFARTILISAKNSIRPEALSQKTGNVFSFPDSINRQLFPETKKNGVFKGFSTIGRTEEEIFEKLKSAALKSEGEGIQGKNFQKIFRHAYLVNVLQRARDSKLKTVESLIRWLVQRWPIIANLSLDPLYKMIHPYSSPSEEEFFKYSLGKQRSAEWFRAKSVQKVLKSLKSIIPIEEEIWSTKQILLWSRFHGYFPWKFQKLNSKTDPAEASANGGKIKSIESCSSGSSNNNSSDSEDGSENFFKSSSSSKSGGNQFVNGSSLAAPEKKKNHKQKRRKKESGEETNSRLVNYKVCNTCTDPSEDSHRFGGNEFRILSSTADSDVEVVEVEREQSVKESPMKKREAEIRLETTPPSEFPFNKFVCETAREIGVKIAEEEILSGIRCDSVSRVISRSVSAFLEDLVRRSYAQGWNRNGDRCPESLEENDILAALTENPHFDIFTNRGLGQEISGLSNPSNSTNLR